jgi:hypothetical protein
MVHLIPYPVAISIGKIRQKNSQVSLFVDTFPSFSWYGIPHKAAKRVEVGDIQQRETKYRARRFEA